ncbi:hypothetical protein DL93DRAFT_2103207 [Clavulina sp. PMI_390]|nr:hypothetical protein DL93DRAFT_2103207 [Clavulina sp. PMI_390]
MVFLRFRHPTALGSLSQDNKGRPCDTVLGAGTRSLPPCALGSAMSNTPDLRDHINAYDFLDVGAYMLTGWKGHSKILGSTSPISLSQSATNIPESIPAPQSFPALRREVIDIPGSPFVSVHLENQITTASVWSRSTKSAPGLLDNWQRIVSGRIVERKSRPLLTTNINGYLFECSINVKGEGVAMFIQHLFWAPWYEFHEHFNCQWWGSALDRQILYSLYYAGAL